jgi:Tfp pilus assembly protein PilO
MKFLKLSSIQTFLTRLSKREKSVLYVAAIIISLTLLDRLVIYPIFSKMEELTEEIGEKEAGIKRSLHILTHKDRILAASVKYKTFIKSSKSEEEEMTALLKEIETLASQSAIYLVDMKPGGVEKTKAAKKYLLSLNCEAQLEQMVEFMYDIEKSAELLTIEKYKLGPKSKDSSVARCSMSISKIALK